MQVIAQILGKEEAPWEAKATAPVLLKKLGHFRGAVLSLLSRDALARPSMAEFQLACNRVLSSTITDSMNDPERADSDSGTSPIGGS